MNELLLLLLKKGGNIRSVTISTTEIGNALNMSQQNASRLMIELEQEGAISRDKRGIMITKSGMEEILAVYGTMKQSLEGKKMTIKGTIALGLGEGGYYISLEGYKKQFREKLGFEPFPGTLNLKLDKEQEEKRLMLREMDPIIIEGWKTEDRSFGDLFAYKCKIDGVEGAIVIPVRTHHGTEVLELVSPVNIKKKLGKKDGDLIKIEIL
ncbi:MAG: DUF120 domain-containing protein [Candidatus Micrarchaeota archaeon]|nr:DUF120 domain-containing protein [Candidatus Micrarchaeota archaeon]